VDHRVPVFGEAFFPVSAGLLQGAFGSVSKWSMHASNQKVAVKQIPGHLKVRMFPKIVGKIPPNHPMFNRVFPINHPFWGIPIFGNTHNNFCAKMCVPF